MRDEVWMYKTKSDNYRNYHIAGKTYAIKEQIKEMKGVWASTKKQWLVAATIENLNKLRALGIRLKVRVRREAFCHDPEEEVYVDSEELKMGFILDNFCGNCDSAYRKQVKIYQLPED